jgi:hypothetical protein
MAHTHVHRRTPHPAAGRPRAGLTTARRWARRTARRAEAQWALVAYTAATAATAAYIVTQMIHAT